MKVCSKCNIQKEVSEFYKRNSKPVAACKECTKKARNEYKANNLEHVKEINRKSWHKHKNRLNSRRRRDQDRKDKANLARRERYSVDSSKVRERNMRRYAKEKACGWRDEVQIEWIYKMCPEGFEVDHIIPLNGKTVSGLHVENNLQYLPISENRSKGNKYGKKK